MNSNPAFPKINLFGKSTNGNSNPNPFTSLSTDNTNNTTNMQPLNPQSIPFPVGNTKNPFGQSNDVKTSNIPYSNTNPFAKVYQDTANSTFPTAKPSTNAFKNPSEPNMTSSNINGFFKQSTNNSTLNNQLSNIFNKNGPHQTSTSGIFNNTPQNNSFNSNNTNKIFAVQGQNQANNFQQQGIFNNQSQQSGIFGNPQPQNSIGFNSQQTNVFNPNQPTQPDQQQNIFNQGQQNVFGQQQNPQQMPMQMQQQPNINMSNALSHYLHLYKQHLGQKHPFQHAMPVQPYDPQANYQFNPQQPNGDYYMFLNNLVSNESIRRNATPWEIFDFAQNWANRVSQKKNQQKQTLEQEETRKQINKLFDVKINPALYQLKMKELPPIQFTMEFLNKLNDPFSCKVIVCQLWFRLKERYSILMNPLKDVASHSDHIKIKELPYYKQMLIMRKQIQSLVEKVTQLKQKDKEIKKEQYQFAGTFKKVLQKYKNAFSEVNLNNKMLQSSNQEMEKMIDYIDRNLKLLFKAYVENQPTSFQDPDQFMLQVSQLISNKLNGLNKMIDDHLAIQSNLEQSVDFLELAENVCNFYEQIAAKLYTVREKMKKMIQIAAQHRSYGCYQELQNKIEEKAKEVMNRKMMVYNKIRNIEGILEGKSKFEDKKQTKTNSPVRSKTARDLFAFQEMRPNLD